MFSQETRSGHIDLAIQNGSQRSWEVLASAQVRRLIVQDYKPFTKSVEWEVGQRYFRVRGSGSFVQDRFPVPYSINNDGTLSTKAAQLLYANLVNAERHGTLEPEIVVLELGIGLGLFARLFLDAFRELCDKEKTRCQFIFSLTAARIVS